MGTRPAGCAQPAPSPSPPQAALSRKCLCIPQMGLGSWALCARLRCPRSGLRLPVCRLGVVERALLSSLGCPCLAERASLYLCPKRHPSACFPCLFLLGQVTSDMAECWSRGLGRLGAWGEGGNPSLSPREPRGRGSHQVNQGYPRSHLIISSHLRSQRPLPQLMAEVVAGGREASGTRTPTKWHLWCNPHRLNVVFKLRCRFKHLSMYGLLLRQIPDTAPREEGRAGQKSVESD